MVGQPGHPRTGRRRWAGAAAAVVAAVSLMACGSSDPSDSSPPGGSTGPADATAGHSGEPGGPRLESPAAYCHDWLRALRPVNRDELDYVARGGRWGGATGFAFDGLQSCDIEPPDVPAAAGAGLDFVRLKLTLAEEEPPAGVDLPELADPTAATVDWETYLERSGATRLRGELTCPGLWDGTNDLTGCDTGGEVDGQAFTYDFAAVHRGVLLAASVEYYTTSLADGAGRAAAENAAELCAAFAAEVAATLPPG